jgi:hypothetical protein
MTPTCPTSSSRTPNASLRVTIPLAVVAVCTASMPGCGNSGSRGAATTAAGASATGGTQTTAGQASGGQAAGGAQAGGAQGTGGASTNAGQPAGDQATAGQAAAGQAMGGSAGGPALGFSVTTNRYDNARSGANLQETTLTTANVNKDKFGLLFSRDIEGQMYAQPLYLSGLKLADRLSVRRRVQAKDPTDRVLHSQPRSPGRVLEPFSQWRSGRHRHSLGRRPARRRLARDAKWDVVRRRRDGHHQAAVEQRAERRSRRARRFLEVRYAGGRERPPVRGHLLEQAARLRSSEMRLESS